MNNTVFCAECRKDVKVITKEVLFKRTLKDNEYTFTGFKAYCGECGSPIYVPEIEDNNLKLLYDAYRKSISDLNTRFCTDFIYEDDDK